MIRFLILGLLRHGERLHGYALVKAYRERSGTDVGSGNFYRELQRLLRDQLVRATANPSKVDARRMPYEITQRGIAAFEEWFAMQDPTFDTTTEDAISARALFLPEVEPAVAHALLKGLREGLWLWSRQLERQRHRNSVTSENGASHGAQSVLSLLLARRQKYAAADLELIEALGSLCGEARQRAEILAADDVRATGGERPGQRSEPLASATQPSHLAPSRAASRC